MKDFPCEGTAEVTNMTLDRGFESRENMTEVRRLRIASAIWPLGAIAVSRLASLAEADTNCSGENGRIPTIGMPSRFSKLLGSCTIPANMASNWQTKTPSTKPSSAPTATILALLGREALRGTMAGSTTSALAVVPAFATCNCWTLFNRLV